MSDTAALDGLIISGSSSSISSMTSDDIEATSHKYSCLEPSGLLISHSSYSCYSKYAPAAMPANGIIAIIRFNRAFAFTFAITLAISFLCLTAVLAASADSRVAVAIACNANTVVPMDSDANAPSSQKTNTVFFNIASMTNTFAYLGSHHVHRLWGLWVSVWVVSVRR
jgi:hypothetical protein